MLSYLLLVGELALLFLMAYTGRRRIKKALNSAKDDVIPAPGDVDAQILSFLKSQGGLAYQSDIAKVLGLPKSTVHKALRRLEEQGAVEIRRQGRANLVVVKGAEEVTR